MHLEAPAHSSIPPSPTLAQKLHTEPFPSFVVFHLLSRLQPDKSSHRHREKRSCCWSHEASGFPFTSLWALVQTAVEAGPLATAPMVTCGKKSDIFDPSWFVPFAVRWKRAYPRRRQTPHDKMCTKRMARPMLSKMTMQIMMVLGLLRRKEHVSPGTLVQHFKNSSLQNKWRLRDVLPRSIMSSKFVSNSFKTAGKVTRLRNSSALTAKQTSKYSERDSPRKHRLASMSIALSLYVGLRSSKGKISFDSFPKDAIRRVYRKQRRAFASLQKKRVCCYSAQKWWSRHFGRDMF